MPTAISPDVAPSEAVVADPLPAFPALSATVSFVRQHALAVLLCSSAVLVPCFWHRHIQATDLGSHVYNAWLAQLIHNGAAPGLHIVPQYSNVLFDLMLSALFNAFGTVAAERIATSVIVLTFFWGGFALCSAAAQSPRWSVMPILAITAYGFMFNMGFFNLYWSVGLSLFALAIISRGRRYDFLLLFPLAALIWMAHLLGTGGLFAFGGYLLIARLLPPRWQLALTSACAATYFLARWYLVHHFQILGRESSLYWMLGTDQFVIYGYRYSWISIATLTVGAIVLCLSLFRDRLEALRRTSLWIQLYGLMALAVALAPGGIWHPKLGLMGYLPDRASLYAAVFMCCLIAAARPTKTQAACYCAIAAVFFSMLYVDTGKMDSLENKVEQAVAQFQPGQRIIATIFPLAGSRIHAQHVVDRACIGHCYYVSNYEPSSGQFRIHADPGNRIVVPAGFDAITMQDGNYVVKESDLPLKELYQCGPGFTQICLHDLSAGEYNGQMAYDQLQAWIREQRSRGTH